MVSLLFTAAMASEPTPRALHVVFDAIPSKAARRKVVRHALKNDRSISGGRDWAYVLCFGFDGPPNTEAIQHALKKAKLVGTVREVPACDAPPQEAFRPPPAETARRVLYESDDDLDTLKPKFNAVLEMGLGVTAVRVPPDAEGEVCFEYETRRVDEEGLRFALSPSNVEIVSIETLPTCTQ